MQLNYINPYSVHQLAKSIEYSQQLIQFPSITPNDAGAQNWLATQFIRLGFDVVHLSSHGVSNLVAKIGVGDKSVGFLGHTDVVPAGALNNWQSPPFAGNIIHGELIGRGAADMKTGIGAMLAAIERYVEEKPTPDVEFYCLITSDEEGEAEYGSKVIKQYLDDNQVELDMCIVGEPTAAFHAGDTIKVGRRGAISAKLSISGVQGHVAYPKDTDNAIHKMGEIIACLNHIEWDEGSEDFPGTGLQITHIDSGSFTDNIVPAHCQICFNIRYSHLYSESTIKAFIEKKICSVTADFNIIWDRACEAYHTYKRPHKDLIGLAEQAIVKNTGVFPILSTAGGTSDGRFFASDKTQVIEVGVSNKTIHQVNERIHVSDLITLEDIYTDLLHLVLKP